MAHNILQRVTTEYIESEDRIRLSCLLDDEVPVVIWLTLRLLRRLVPAMMKPMQKELEAVISAEMTQRFAQFAVKGVTMPTATVSHPSANDTWLAVSVDVTRLPQGLRITFRGGEKQSAIWVLAPTQLRKWLDILYYAFVKGGWQLDIWPAWVQLGVIESELDSAVWN